MVNIPLTKMIFHVDNGFGTQLSGTRLSATYDFLGKKIIWRKWEKNAVKKQQSLIQKILSFLPISSPFIIVPIIVFLGDYSTEVMTPYERFHTLSNILPIVLGLLMFISFESVMLYFMSRPTEIKPPTKEIQRKYFNEIYDFAIKHNNAVGNYKTPYLVNIVVTLFILFIVLPLMFLVYNQSDTLGTFIAKLVVYGLFLSLIPNFIWNLIVKAFLIKRIIKKIDKEMGEEKLN